MGVSGLCAHALWVHRTVCGERGTHALVNAFSTGTYISPPEAAIAARLFVTMQPPDTPTIAKASLRPVDKLEDRRYNTMEDIGPLIKAIEVDTFFKLLVPQPEPSLLGQSYYELFRIGALNDDGWTDFMQSPKTDNNHEDVVFAPFQDIVNSILTSVQSQTRTCVMAYVQLPTTGPRWERLESTSKPDGFGYIGNPGDELTRYAERIHEDKRRRERTQRTQRERNNYVRERLTRPRSGQLSDDDEFEEFLWKSRGREPVRQLSHNDVLEELRRESRGREPVQQRGRDRRVRTTTSLPRGRLFDDENSQERERGRGRMQHGPAQRVRSTTSLPKGFLPVDEDPWEHDLPWPSSSARQHSRYHSLEASPLQMPFWHEIIFAAQFKKSDTLVEARNRVCLCMVSSAKEVLTGMWLECSTNMRGPCTDHARRPSSTVHLRRYPGKLQNETVVL